MGGWNPTTAAHWYGVCERTAPGMLAEPLNVLTSFAFIFVAIAIFRYYRAHEDVRGHWVGDIHFLTANTFLIGTCSIIFHTVPTPMTEAFDEGSIVVFIVVYFWSVLFRIGRCSLFQAAICFIAFAGFSHMLVYQFPAFAERLDRLSVVDAGAHHDRGLPASEGAAQLAVFHAGGDHRLRLAVLPRHRPRGVPAIPLRHALPVAHAERDAALYPAQADHPQRQTARRASSAWRGIRARYEHAHLPRRLLRARGRSPGIWGEPANLLTNGLFILAAILAARILLKAKKHGLRERGDQWLLIAALLAIGIGSGLWHAIPNGHTVLLDVIPITIYIHVYLIAALRRLLLRFDWTKTLSLWGNFLLAGILAQLLLPPDMLNGTIMYIPTYATLIISHRRAVASRRGEGPRLPQRGHRVDGVAHLPHRRHGHLPAFRPRHAFPLALRSTPGCSTGCSRCWPPPER
ncbi:MAG: ceramidase domain-containing protein, partial [Alphaproteobacteria bacterium]